MMWYFLSIYYQFSMARFLCRISKGSVSCNQFPYTLVNSSDKKKIGIIWFLVHISLLIKLTRKLIFSLAMEFGENIFFYFFLICSNYSFLKTHCGTFCFFFQVTRKLSDPNPVGERKVSWPPLVFSLFNICKPRQGMSNIV